MKQVLPEPTVHIFQTNDRITPPSVPVKRRVVESLPYAEAMSNTRKPKFEIDGEEHNVAEEVSDYGREKFDELANPYLKPCLYNVIFLDKQ
jgi:hypothetical protein